ncbi:hypothetical protein [Mesorhizobium sp. M0478]|uniref:hypothetical protein n=1 Tax=Mesorhizobium sp. M0478 TaxID=2956947 RepID=UPI00333A4208
MVPWSFFAAGINRPVVGSRVKKSIVPRAGPFVKRFGRRAPALKISYFKWLFL